VKGHLSAQTVMQTWRVLTVEQRTGAVERVTWKAIVIGLILVIGITVAGCFSAFLRYDLIGTGHLPRCALFPVMVLAALNGVSKWLFGKPLLTRAELLTIYCTVLVMTGIPGQQYADYLYLGLIAPIYFANPRNMPELLQYDINWLPYIPDWLVPSKDPRSGVIAWVMEGMPEGARIPWQAWVLPLAIWTVFFVALFTAHLVIAAALRRQWADNEKLTFPLAQIPVEVADERRLVAAARNPLFWFGFLIPTVIYILRALHLYYPTFPNVNIYPNWGALFQNRPLDVLNYMPFNLYFDMIGITYFVATDVGFSFWFFWVVRRLQMVARSAMGLSDHQQPLEQQSIGGLFALFLMHAYIARHYFRDFFRRALKGERGETDGEPLPPRALVLLSLLTVGGIIVWSVVVARLALLWAVLLFVVHFIWRIMLTRMVAEAGLFVFWTPIPITNFFMRVFGRDLVGTPNIVAMNMIGSKISDSATDVTAQALQGLKIAQLGGLSQRQIFGLMWTSLLISILTCHPTCLHIIYTTAVPKMGWWTRGYPRGMATTMLNQLAQDLRMPTAHYIHLLAGALVTMVLTWLRWQFLWWLFHPLGYAASNAVSWFGDRYGFSIFLGWLAKALVMWFGGIRLWHFFKPFMLGMVLGNTAVLFVLLLVHFFFPTNEVVVIE